MHSENPLPFYHTLRNVLDNPNDSMWENEAFVVLVVHRAWRAATSGDVASCWCRKIGNFSVNIHLLMRHRAAVDVIIDVLGTSSILWIADRMASILSAMQKADPTYFSGDDCADMAAATARFSQGKASHSRIINRIERVVKRAMHPRHQDFDADMGVIFQLNAGGAFGAGAFGAPVERGGAPSAHQLNQRGTRTNAEISRMFDAARNFLLCQN